MNFEDDKDHARKALLLEERIAHMQNAYLAIQNCRWPVLVGINGACIGAGVDMLTTFDIAYATKQSFFSIKEVDIGMAADLGTLQRIPILANNWGLMKEYAMTGNRIPAEEAQKIGLVARVFDTPEQMKENLFKLADLIASKSPVAIVNVKHHINTPIRYEVERGLLDIRRTNMSQLFTDDMALAATANLQKKSVTFQKL